MKIFLVRHLWGVNLANGFTPHVAGWLETGYEALETSIRLVPDRSDFLRTLREQRLGWIPQVFSNRPIPAGSPDDHLRSLEEQVNECLDASPLFFNAQSGSDGWSITEAEDFFGAALNLEKRIGITIAHETHRSRFFADPWKTRDIMLTYPDLKLTCDFSHWVCVAERLLQDCDDIIERAASQAWHLHARVGYEEGPQVPDPRAPEWAGHLNAHESWWDRIWRSQQARGFKLSSLTPEFGPPPYLHTMPYTGEPVSDLDSICDWMARRQKERFSSRAEMLP